MKRKLIHTKVSLKRFVSFSLILLIVVIIAFKTGDLRYTLSSLDKSTILLALLLIITGRMLRTITWALLIYPLDKISLAKVKWLFVIHSCGMLFNILIPKAQYLFRVIMLEKILKIQKEKGTFSIISEVYMTLMVSFLLLVPLVSILGSSQLLDSILKKLFLLLLFFFIFIVVISVVKRIIPTQIREKIVSFVSYQITTFREIFIEQPRNIANISILFLIIIYTETYAFFTIVQGLNIPLNFTHILLIGILSGLLGHVLSITPGGIGTVEMATTGLLVSWGVTVHLALTASLIWRGLVILTSFSLGLPSYYVLVKA